MKSKKSLLVLGAILLITLIIFFSGPWVPLDVTLHSVSLPDDLDRYLAESEAAFDDITPGAEKTITWAGTPGTQTPLAVVGLHGFSATRQETAPLAQMVAAELGANLYETRFTGHGRTGEAMLEGSVNAWLNDGWEALQIGQRIGERVIVIGVSTGGSVAAWLAAQPGTERIAATILISPNFAPADGRSTMLTWPWGEQLALAIIGPERSWEPHNEGQARYWTHRYPTQAVLPLGGLVKLVGDLDLSAVLQPFLVIYSPDDEVVDPAATEAAFARLGSLEKELVIFRNVGDPSQHVLAGDILSPESTAPIAARILEFVRGD